MIARAIIARLRAGRRALAARLPAPMAAPETPRLRTMRMTLIAQLSLLAVLTAAWPLVASTSFRALGAFAWLALALSSLSVGLRWVIAKLRADGAWIDRAPANREHGE